MQRLTRLDGLRGVLAVYVMLNHALPFTCLPGAVTAPFEHGEAAVDLFFALSGLVILQSLEKFKGRFWPFMAARARRLLPVYFIVLVLAVVLLFCGAPLRVMPWIGPGSAAAQTWTMAAPPHLAWHIAAHVALLHGIIPQGVLPYVWISLLGPAWSLSTEWQFYVVMALALPGLGLRGLAAFLLALGAGWFFAAPFLPDYWRFSRAFLPDAAPYFAIGLGAAVWLRGGGVWLFVICLAVASALGFESGSALRGLIPFGWALVILVQKHKVFPVLGALLDSRAAQFLGAVSYPLYLVNEPVQRGLALLIAPFCRGDAVAFSWVWLPLALSVPLGVAVALHYGVEARFMKAWMPDQVRHDGVNKLATGAFRPRPPEAL